MDRAVFLSAEQGRVMVKICRVERNITKEQEVTKEFVQILILQKYVIGNCSLDPWSVFPASTPQFQAFSRGGVGGAWMVFYGAGRGEFPLQHFTARQIGKY